jgi:cell division protein FtsL
VALTIALAAFFLILFGVALLQTVLVQGQVRLDGLRADVTERQIEAQLLRDEVSRLESPENIVGQAEAMGMESKDPRYVPQLPEASVETP